MAGPVKKSLTSARRHAYPLPSVVKAWTACRAHRPLSTCTLSVLAAPVPAAGPRASVDIRTPSVSEGPGLSSPGPSLTLGVRIGRRSETEWDGQAHRADLRVLWLAPGRAAGVPGAGQAARLPAGRGG